MRLNLHTTTYKEASWFRTRTRLEPFWRARPRDRGCAAERGTSSRRWVCPSTVRSPAHSAPGYDGSKNSIELTEPLPKSSIEFIFCRKFRHNSAFADNLIGSRQDWKFDKSVPINSSNTQSLGSSKICWQFISIITTIPGANEKLAAHSHSKNSNTSTTVAFTKT